MSRTWRTKSADEDARCRGSSGGLEMNKRREARARAVMLGRLSLSGVGSGVGRIQVDVDVRRSAAEAKGPSH